MLELGQRIEEGSEGNWNNYLRHVEVDKVDCQDGNRGKGWNEEFVAPADIEEVVSYSKDCDGLQREKTGDIGEELEWKLAGSVRILILNKMQEK